MKKIFKKIFQVLFLVIVVMAAVVGGDVFEKAFGYRIADFILPHSRTEAGERIIERKVLKEESVVIDVVDKVGPAVVTVGIKKKEVYIDPFSDFWDPFGIFGFRRRSVQEKDIEQDIGSGFIVSKDGLVITNKHVVSDTSAQYRVFTKDNKLYEVQKIYRDPVNDLAILKIDTKGEKLSVAELGDSSTLKVGQFVIAIGAALGEFRNTVTTGVISGLGRSITAGSPFEGVENLDNVIQTDAAINPGNSGGPLLNSAGQVIGVNVAMASGAQNIGFALPINTVKEMLDNFNKTGQFSRPFLGVRYRDIEAAEAVAKGWVEGAGIVEVVEGSPAEKAGIKMGDIITEIDGEKVTKDNSLAKIIAKKKAGQEIKITIWRSGEKKTLSVVLKEAS